MNESSGLSNKAHFRKLIYNYRQETTYFCN